jgi:ribosomal protein L37E
MFLLWSLSLLFSSLPVEKILNMSFLKKGKKKEPSHRTFIVQDVLICRGSTPRCNGLSRWQKTRCAVCNFKQKKRSRAFLGKEKNKEEKKTIYPLGHCVIHFLSSSSYRCTIDDAGVDEELRLLSRPPAPSSDTGGD